MSEGQNEGIKCPGCGEVGNSVIPMEDYDMWGQEESIQDIEIDFRYHCQNEDCRVRTYASHGSVVKTTSTSDKRVSSISDMKERLIDD